MKIFVIVGMLLIWGWTGNNAQSPNEMNQAGMRGRVVDLTGRPLKGTRVTLHFDEKRVFDTETDASGEYIFHALPSGKADFTVNETGFRKYKTNLYINPGGQTIFDIGLQVGLVNDAPNLAVRGSVRSNNSKQLENVSVIARSVFNSDVVVFCRTSKNGTFELQLPSYGQYFVYAASPGKKSDVRLLNVNTEETYITNFVLILLPD